MNRLIFIFAITILSASSSLFAQQFSTPIKVNTETGLSSEKAPIMAIGRDGTIYISWVKGNGTGSSIWMSHSTDGGSTFSAPVNACADANSNSDAQRTAKFVLDTKGGIHMIWMATRKDKNPDVWYIRSTDNGTTWTSPMTLCDAGDSNKFAQDFPAIACDSNDNLYASWLDFREPSIPGISPHGHIYFTKSTDHGTTWSKNIKADNMPGGIGGTCECCAQHIAVSPTGNIYIGFRSNIQELRNIYLARSTDKGETFELSLKIADGDWSLAACPMKGPNIRLDESETLHMAWGDAREGPIHLYYASIPKGSTATPKNYQFDDPDATAINYPDVAVYKNGTVRALGYQTANFGIKYILTNGSTTIIDNQPLPMGSNQAYITVLFTPDGTRYLSYQDSKAGSPDIYFCKETISLSSSDVATEDKEKQITIYPNPVQEQTSFTLSYSGNLPLTMKIVDVLGKEVYQTTLSGAIAAQRIEIPELAAGCYYCLFTGAGVHLTKPLIVN